MTRTFTITIFLLLIYGTVFSQVGGTDEQRESLKHKLALPGNDTNRILVMVELTNAYCGYNSDSLHFYGNKAIELAEQMRFPRGEARALIALAFGVQIDGDIPKSLEYLYRALEIAEEKHYAYETATCYTGIGNAHWFLGDYQKTVIFEKKAGDLFNTIISQQGVSEWILFNNLNIGQAYLEFNLDSAYHYLSQCYEASMHNTYWHPFASALLGDCLFRRGDREVSFNYVRESIPGASENDDFITQAEAFATISGFFKTIHQPDSAIYYAHKGLHASDSSAYLLGIYKTSKLLAEEYEKFNVKEALHYRKIYDSVSERLYGVKKVQDLQKTLAEEQLRQQQIQKAQLEKENRLKQYGFLAGLAIMLLIAFFLYRNNRQKQTANLVLQEQKDKVEKTLQDLKSTQAQLIQSEKMASLGELTAGIAHEIQNPLNFVNNFSEVNAELIDELEQEANKGNLDEVKVLTKEIKGNEQKINHHGKRADAIVKGMLQHSQKGSGVKEPTDINALADEYLRLAYHGLRAKDKSFNATIKTDFDQSIGNINIIPQEIGRVLLNLINNAFYAVDEKSKAGVPDYKREVVVSTKLANNQKNEPISQLANSLIISVRDNGNGIPDAIKEKIFQPFFTTKPTGEGTGLGLSLSYDIVKAHGGELIVETKENEGSNFIFTLPIT